MSDNSAIEWTDASWNPVRARLLHKVGNKAKGSIGWHCEHVTPGCEVCYAERFNQRLGTGLPFKPGHRKDVELFLDDNMLMLPLRWKKPRRIFVGSMTDLFADFVSDEWIDKMFAVMAMSPQHTFQVLTKRAQRMRDYFERHDRPLKWVWHACQLGKIVSCYDVADADTAVGWSYNGLPNVWLGVSTERQQEADERIPLLLQTPAAVRFISAEPLLGPINLTSINHRGVVGGHSALDDHGLGKLDWVIVGGESGPAARPMHPDWVRSLRDACTAADTPFFFKQWGEWLPWSQFSSTAIDLKDDPEQTRFRTAEWTGDIWEDVGRPMWCDTADGNIDDEQCVGCVGKKRAGRLLDGVEHNWLPPVETF